MSGKLKISIPKPCHEDWDQMTPVEQGNYCGSCQKVVMDFTSMSDTQIIAYFKNGGSSTCGRFHNDQLDRDMHMPKKRLPWIKYFFQVAIPAFLFSCRNEITGAISLPEVEVSNLTSGKIEAPALQPEYPPIVGDTIAFVDEEPIVNTAVVEKKDPEIVPLKETKDYSPRVNNADRSEIRKFVAHPVMIHVEQLVEARVVDTSGKAVPFATVTIKESGNVTVTDEQGWFRIDVSNVKDPGLVISSVSYVAREISPEHILDKQIVLQLFVEDLDNVSVQSGWSTIRLGGMMGGFYVRSEEKTTPPLLKKIWGGNSVQFKMYPNPARSGARITIEWRSAAGDHQWQILDMSGRMISRGELHILDKVSNYSLQLPSVPAGTYIISFTNKKGKSLSEKIIIN